MASPSLLDTGRHTPAGVALHVSVARTAAEVDALREPWSRLLADRLPADPDFLLSLMSSEPRVVGPWVLAAERDNAVVAILVGRVEDVRLPCRVGYRSVRLPRLRSLTVVPGGLLGEASDSVIEAFLGALRAALARREVDVVVFRELPVGSALHRAVEATGSMLARDNVVRRTVRRELTLPESHDAFLASLSKSTRDSVRRYRNKLERELGDRLETRLFRDPSELDELLEGLAAVTAKSWQRDLDTSFRDDDAHRARILLALERGWLRACVVSVDGQPAAFWLAQGCGGRFVLGIPGFDPAYSDYRIGQYALLALIASLCEDPAASTLDFGYGDAEYKRRFGTGSWEEETLILFSARPRPLFVNATRTALVGSTELCRTLLTRVGFPGRLRSGWRGRLAGRHAAGSVDR